MATIVLRDGFVTTEFVELVGRDERADDEERLRSLKGELADRVIAAPPKRLRLAGLRTGLERNSSMFPTR